MKQFVSILVAFVMEAKMKSIKNSFAMIVGGLFCFASTASLANPVAWTAPGGNMAGQYCYDFGGYVWGHTIMKTGL